MALSDPISAKQLAHLTKAADQREIPADIDEAGLPVFEELTRGEASELLSWLWSLPFRQKSTVQTKAAAAVEHSEWLRTGRAIITFTDDSGREWEFKLTAWRGPKKDNPTLSDPVRRYYVRHGHWPSDRFATIEASDLTVWFEGSIDPEARAMFSDFMHHVRETGDIGGTSGFEIKLEDRCAWCGHALTDPESVKRGLGPVCAKRAAAEAAA